MVLTNDDLDKVSQIINVAVEPVKQDVSGLKQDVSGLKQDVGRQTKEIEKMGKKLDKTIDFFDHDYLDMRKKVKRIEGHLGLSPFVS